MMRRQADRRRDPALGFVALLAVLILMFALLEVGHLQNIANLQQQARANTAAIREVKALLQELRSDEARYCAAAKLGGDPHIIAVVCPPGGSK